MSTVLAQDHFYSDFLSLSLTILTHKGSMRMIAVRCEMESALAFVTGGMNTCTANYLNGATFVMTWHILYDIGKITRPVQKSSDTARVGAARFNAMFHIVVFEST